MDTNYENEEMNSNKSSKVRKIPYQRNCLIECTEGIVTRVSGELPQWLSGTLLRNGPGLSKIGDTEYKQIFDGLALIQQFVMDGSTNSVTYRNRFVQSATYKANKAANRIVVSELGTRAHPDPCKSLLRRLLFYYSRQHTDNNVVNFLTMGDEVYAVTETPRIWQVDPETLETKRFVDMSKFVAVHTVTAHSHVDEKENCVYYFGSRYGLKPVHCVIRMPLKDGLLDALKEAEIIATIPVKNKYAPNYYHSFGMTENYVIFIEQPMSINVRTVPKNFFKGKPLAANITWDPSQKTRFILVNRKSGRTVRTDYVAKAFAFFHIINSYEENGQVVVDICAFEDGRVIERLYADIFHETYMDKEAGNEATFHSEGRRYFLPLDPDQDLYGVRHKVAHVQHEKLTTRGFNTAEYPRINDAYDGKKYRFFYAITHRDSDALTQLIKVNCDTKEVKYWFQDDYFPSEPVFIANPEGVDEDDGVVVSAIVHETIETIGFLLILDAKSFTELARANFECPSAIPTDVHGIFLNAHKLQPA